MDKTEIIRLLQMVEFVFRDYDVSTYISNKCVDMITRIKDADKIE